MRIISVLETWMYGCAAASIILPLGAILGLPFYAALMIAAGLLLVSASKKIEIGFKGVVTFFGKRLGIVLGEGIHFLPRWLGLDFKEIDCREKGIDIPAIEVPTRDGMVIINAALRYRVDNPCKFLSVDLGQGLKTLTEQVLRAKMAGKTTEEATRLHLEIQNDLQKKCDEKGKDWGIDARNVLVTSIDLPHKEKEAREKITVEEQERRAEAVEQEFIRQQIKKHTEMGIPVEVAIELLQSERGKIKKEVREYRVPGLEKGLQVNLGGGDKE